ncbi:MAG: ATP-binding protein [Bacillota bacterium]
MALSLHRDLWRKVGQGVADYQMIQDGDVIAIGVSGGKDSLLLCHALARLQKVAPISFRLQAITLDLGWGADWEPVRTHLAELGVPYHVESTPTIGRAVKGEVAKGNGPCSLCGHLRRGALYTSAKSFGANKVALGHHRDDAIETLLMSMFYEGRSRCFKPVMFSDRQELTLIRPLIYVAETTVKQAIEHFQLPIVKNPCPANGETKRQEIKELLANYQQQNPMVKENLLRTLMGMWQNSPQPTARSPQSLDDQS